MNFILIRSRKKRRSTSQWDGANNICLVYLPSSHLLAQWVGSLKLEKIVLPVSHSDFIFFASAAVSLFQVHCQEVLQGEEQLVPSVSDPVHVLAKKWSNSPKAKHHLDSDFSSSLLSTGRKLSSMFVRALQKKAAGSKPPLMFFFFSSWTFEPKNLGWSHLALTYACVVSMAILRRAAQVESQLPSQTSSIFPGTPHQLTCDNWLCTCSCTTSMQGKTEFPKIPSLL